MTHKQVEFTAFGVFDLGLDVLFCTDILICFVTAYSERGVFVTGYLLSFVFFFSSFFSFFFEDISLAPTTHLLCNREWERERERESFMLICFVTAYSEGGSMSQVTFFFFLFHFSFSFFFDFISLARTSSSTVSLPIVQEGSLSQVTFFFLFSFLKTFFLPGLPHQLYRCL